jgi:hypothetical protein
MAKQKNESAAAEQAPKTRHRGGRPKKKDAGKAEIERQERIAEALDYRRQGFTYQQISDTMECSVSHAYELVQEGISAIPAEPAKALRTLMLEQCFMVLQQVVPLLQEECSAEVTGILFRAQNQIMRLTGMDAGFSLPDDEGEHGDSEAAVILRIKASAPVLRPDAPGPANPVL